jgi:PAS domain S-box-containing protein
MPQPPESEPGEPLLIEDNAALLAAIVASMIGKTIRTLIPEELQSEEDEFLARISAGERIQNHETVRLHKSGRRIEVSVTVSPVRDQSGKIIGASKIVRDITQRKLIEREIALLAAIVTSTSDGILSWNPGGIFTSCNGAVEKLLGFAPAELMGQSANLLIPEELRGKEKGVAACILRGEPVPPYETVRLHKNGTRISSSVTNSPIRFPDGTVIGGSTIIRDITDLKRREEQILLLLREVNHRSRNMLAVVQAIARLSAATQPSDFVERFSDRIRALAASQELLTQSRWSSVQLHDLIWSQLAHLRDLIGTRIVLDGADTLINPDAAQAIGMAVHELVTNAGKYGALSGSSGVVEISWRIEHQQETEDTFRMEWRETGGPEARMPERLGFGMAVLTKIIDDRLKGKSKLAFEQSGLRWRLECPAVEVLESQRPIPAKSEA